MKGRPLKWWLMTGAILILMGLTSFLIFNNKSTESSKDAPFEYTERDSLESVPDSEETPIMYDFVHSSMGYKSDIDINKYGNSFSILVKNDYLDKDQGTIHVLRTYPTDYFPPISTGSVSISLPEAKWQTAKTAFKSWPKDSKFKEKDYSLYVIKQSVDKDSLYEYTESTEGVIWNGIDLNSLKYPKGWLQENIDRGWDTDWVNKSPYKQELLKHYDIDVTNKFFDKYKIHQVIEVTKIGDESDVRRIKVVNTDQFKTLEKPVWVMSLQQMNAQLKQEGYNSIP